MAGEIQEPILRRVGWRRGDEGGGVDGLLNREWLVTNGLGGYASGTLGGFMTRRYHGLLVAALPNPLGRTMMLNHLYASVKLPSGREATLEAQETSGGLDAVAAEHLDEFRLELGLPVWTYRIGEHGQDSVQETVIERRVFFAYLQNTVFVQYKLLSANQPVRLSLRPAVDFRVHDAALGTREARPYQVRITEDRMEIRSTEVYPSLNLFLKADKSAFVHQPGRLSELLFRVEAARGYASQGELWSPGHFDVELLPNQPITLVASTERWDTLLAMTPTLAHQFERLRRTRLAELASPRGAADAVAGELALAADQFLILPAGRVADATRAQAMGEELRTVIAGYHWFTDWGRDTMISLEGLTLVTGRWAEARWILRAFAHYIRDGLLPNHFPEGAQDGVYHTADATLWYFHAVARYLAYTNDRRTLQALLPALEAIVEHHRTGTRFGIRVDEDGLLTQGSPNHPLTWMDAKCADWVVTPRRGKPVEINALWYNALCHMAHWITTERGEAAAANLRAMAEKTRAAFNARFWFDKGKHLYDIVDGEAGDDPALRPNQLFAISLTHPVLEPAKWAPVFEAVSKALLTPVGLRSLDPHHADYKRTYHGDLKTRDAAYHQGTVWSFLIGPYVDVFLRLHPSERPAAQQFLEGLIAHLGDAGVGSISEVFDAEPPYTARGCMAQAWGVAELLRAFRMVNAL